MQQNLMNQMMPKISDMITQQFSIFQNNMMKMNKNMHIQSSRSSPNNQGQTGKNMGQNYNNVNRNVNNQNIGGFNGNNMANMNSFGTMNTNNLGNFNGNNVRYNQNIPCNMIGNLNTHNDFAVSNMDFDRWAQISDNKRSNDKMMVCLHPFLSDCFTTGMQIPKNLASIKDIHIIKMIMKWNPGNENQRLQKQLLIKAILKIEENQLNINRQLDENNPSILSVLISKINGQIFTNGMVDPREVDIWYSEIVLKAFSLNNDHHGEYQNRKIGVCREYNSKQGCSTSNCKFRHICQFHYNKKVHASHSIQECKEARKS